MASTFLKASKLLSRKGLYPFLMAELSCAPAGGRVLNVGAGGEVQAAMKAVVHRLGLQVVNSDVDPGRGPDVVDDITRSAFPDSHFDIVVMIEVLEHVLDPQAAANEIMRVLKPRGRLILSTPFIYPLHDLPHDYFRYTKFGLAHLFKAFDEVNITERNSWGEAIIVLVARLSSIGGRQGRLASWVAVPMAYALWPLAKIGSVLFKSEFLTTGYCLSAVRPPLPGASTKAPSPESVFSDH